MLFDSLIKSSNVLNNHYAYKAAKSTVLLHLVQQQQEQQIS